MEKARYMTAKEAAAELNVSRATLYAYVSRGLIRSEPSENARQRLYRADDVGGLRERKAPRRAGHYGTGDALNFGAPVLASAITLIADDGFYYRGRNVTKLARGASLEHVAAILWQQENHDVFDSQPPRDPLPGNFPAGLPRALASLALAGEADLAALNLQRDSVARTGGRILRLLTAAFTGTLPASAAVHLQLANAWLVDGPASDLIRAALVLSADHELNTSTFTARCAASTGSTPHAAVIAALAALQGPKHGGQTVNVWAMLDELERGLGARHGIANRLRRGDRIAGFGHPLYPNGDPRARLLLELMSELPELEARLAGYRRVADAVGDLTGLAPNIDFTLTVLARILALPESAPFTLFAIGRSVGWVAHIQEQYASKALLRPRARYIGEMPAER